MADGVGLQLQGKKQDETGGGESGRLADWGLRVGEQHCAHLADEVVDDTRALGVHKVLAGTLQRAEVGADLLNLVQNGRDGRVALQGRVFVGKGVRKLCGETNPKK